MLTDWNEHMSTLPQSKRNSINLDCVFIYRRIFNSSFLHFYVSKPFLRHIVSRMFSRLLACRLVFACHRLCIARTSQDSITHNRVSAIDDNKCEPFSLSNTRVPFRSFHCENELIDYYLSSNNFGQIYIILHDFNWYWKKNINF